MSKVFIVNFVWDTGWSLLEETSVVVAENEKEAEDKLRKYIGSLRSDSCVRKISNMAESEQNVFVIKNIC